MPNQSLGAKLKTRFSILVVPSGGGRHRQFEISPRLLLSWAGVMVLVLAAILFVFSGGPDRMQARQLAAKNQAMVEELAGIRQQVASLEGAVEGLSEQNAQARALAGLESIDAEVLQAGVGGPGTTTPRSHPLWGLDSLYSKDAFATSFDLKALQRRVQLLGTSLTEAADSLNQHRDWLESFPSILPARGFISSGFSSSRMHPIHHRPLPHEGMDISAPAGSPIVATAKGKVTSTGRRSGYGLTVLVEHGFGYETLYGHASQILVRTGQEVERGDVIALVGSTGITTAPHVHYEVRQNGRPIDPHRFVIDVIP
ncbi:MAG: M23 family metallopeptidase [Gammaproteobacteria bacterium]|nr:M23 family metallopeptidase [Gammaproteobacteria bacterium]MYF61813.1 M23 family metallopeptidase [Gammaproteobacteria bacterium]MYI23401.1 M23 family metallopeptidase [Gammaproteobacteria bacterium]